jgi:proline utilization trans-activator
MDGEHIFSAALVLVMVCLSFPYDAESTSAMNAALALLERMADRGNTKMLDRYELLSGVRKQIETRAAVIDIAQTSPVPAENAILADPMISTFPHVDNSALGDLFYDTNTMDFDLWEEGYTNQDMDFEQDLTDWIQSGGNTWNNNLS